MKGIWEEGESGREYYCTSQTIWSHMMSSDEDLVNQHPYGLCVKKIKLLELELQCFLQVIHVPGTIMIQQGTDGLSRGVDMQALGSHRSDSLISLLWRTSSPTPNLLQWALSSIPPCYSSNTSWMFQTDFSDWGGSLILNKSVFWCLSPSFNRQAILQALSIWVESPTSCGHIFLVPRILERDFGRLSKFVIYNGQYDNLSFSFTPIITPPSNTFIPLFISLPLVCS